MNVAAKINLKERSSMVKIKVAFIFSLLLGIVACAGLQTTEETVNSIELKGHQISVGMPSEKVRELVGEPDSIVQGMTFDPAGQTGTALGGQGNIAAAAYTWWRYFGEGQDVNLKIDEAGYVKEIIVTRYSG
ncbi:MAG: hypothetical protein ABF303_05205 [Desulfobacterales bacterium]